MDFYDCEVVLPPGYESPDKDANNLIKQTHRRQAGSTVKQKITESSTDSIRAMFAQLTQKFMREDMHTIFTIQMELNLCHQGPEGELTDFLGKMDANYARLKDFGAEVLDGNKRVHSQLK